MTRKEKIQFLIIHTIGNFLILLGLYLVFTTFGPAVSQEIRFRVEKVRGIAYRIEHKPKRSWTSPSTGSGRSQDDKSCVNCKKASYPSADVLSAFFGDAQDRILISPDTYFSILIPKIGAASRIIPNIDPTNEKDFRRVLINGVAHAKGTVFPGMRGTIYLFAHSTDTSLNVGQYNAVFYLLKELEKGDQIVIYFQDIRYNYTVTEKRIADPSDVSLLTDRGDKEKLVLQTCWPPGTTFKRLFVIAKPSLQVKDPKSK